MTLLWRRPGVDASLRNVFSDISLRANLRSTPIIVDGVLHTPNGWGLVEEFDPGTGETVWVQDPWEGSQAEVSSQSTRGVDYWVLGPRILVQKR